MRRFKNVQEFVVFMQGRLSAVPGAEQVGLKHAAGIIEKEAKAEIGNYQTAAGPFAAWEPLSSATLEGFDHPVAGHIQGKEELGYAPPDNPLLREGHLRESIGHYVEGHKAVIGSSDPVAVYQELGTTNALYPIPPRSFLGGAAVRKAHEAVDAVAEPVVALLAGKI